MKKIPLKIIATIFLLSILGLGSIKAQVMEPGSVIANQAWEDRNGYNELYIKVYAACNPDKPPYDGHESEIQVRLKNKNHELNIHYELEDYQMQMLFFSQKNIRYFNFEKIRAVFIPFSYCGNADTINRVSYIILYDDSSYLKHIDFYCTEAGKCKLLSDLVILSDIPDILRERLISELERYNDIEDFLQ